MKKTTLVLLALLAATPAWAEDSLLVQTCFQAANHFYQAKFESGKMQEIVVQDFSNLTPPRVRINMGNIFKMACTFSSATKPVRLTEFCGPKDVTLLALADPASSCYQAGNMRFDELVELMRRDGD